MMQVVCREGWSPCTVVPSAAVTDSPVTWVPDSNTDILQGVGKI